MRNLASGNWPEWHGIKAIFVDFMGLDHKAVKIAKHTNSLFSDPYEPHGKQSVSSAPLIFKRNLA
jgi:hypothetical protein